MDFNRRDRCLRGKESSILASPEPCIFIGWVICESLECILLCCILSVQTLKRMRRLLCAVVRPWASALKTAGKACSIQLSCDASSCCLHER